MISEWALNAIVLNHVHRFFAAATVAVVDWDRDLKEDEGTKLAVVGNVLWVESGFLASTDAGEEMLGLVGALAGSLGSAISEGGGVTTERMLQVLTEQEQKALGEVDVIVANLMTRLENTQVQCESLGAVNDFVWKNLFPGFSWPTSALGLRAEISRALFE